MGVQPQAAVGFGPTNTSIAYWHLCPLGYAAKSRSEATTATYIVGKKKQTL